MQKKEILIQSKNKIFATLLFCAIIIIMNTIMKTINSNKIDQEILDQAADLLKQGELVAFPTETVYGLGADALRPEASKKIYAAKGRPSDNPLIIHVAEFDALYHIAKEVPKKAKALAEKFWPGPLTMILPKSEAVPYETTGGMDTVAIRMPDHPLALALIKAGGGYVAAPSANTSGRPSPTLAEHVYQDLAGKVAMILDGGAVGIGLESTIVDLSEEIPMILRPGYITKEMLAEVIGEVRMDPGLIAADSDVKPKAPGMKYRHYAPKANLMIVKGEPEAVIDKINALTRECVSEGKKAGVIGTDETILRYEADVVKSIGSREDEDSIARHLYGILRDYDEMDVDCIFSESFSTPRIGHAIMNRLLKAAGHQIIEV